MCCNASSGDPFKPARGQPGHRNGRDSCASSGTGEVAHVSCFSKNKKIFCIGSKRGMYPLMPSMRMKHANLKKMMLIEWADSRQPTSGWAFLDDADQHTYCRCYSIGFVVREDQEMIALAANMADIEDKPQTTGVIVIPRVAVLKRTELTSSSRPESAQTRRQT